MQHTDKHRAFEGKAEPPPLRQLFNNPAAAALFPEPAKQQCCTDAHTGTALKGCGLAAGDQHGGLGETCAGAQQGVELAVGFEVFDAPECGQHALAGAPAIAGVLHDLQIAAVARGFDAKEHAVPS